MRYLLLSLLLLFLLPKSVFAQEFNVSVEPTVIQIDATPPTTIQSPFTIKNLASETITLTPRLIPFRPDESGTGKVMLLFSQEHNLSSVIKDRLKIAEGKEVIDKITLQPNETKELSLSLELQKGDPIGDYYFSLVFISQGEELKEANTSLLPAGIAINAILSIGPKAPGSASIDKFTAPRYLSSGPVPFELKVSNTAAHMIQPEGQIIIKNMLGKEVAHLPILPQYILVNSSRFLVSKDQASSSAELTKLLNEANITSPVVLWKEKFLMGYYTAIAEISLQNDENVVRATTHFFAFPTTAVFVISGIIFIILGITLRIRKRLRIVKTNKS